jgi:hypothetical protein
MVKCCFIMSRTFSVIRPTEPNPKGAEPQRESCFAVRSQFVVPRLQGASLCIATMLPGREAL